MTASAKQTSIKLHPGYIGYEITVEVTKYLEKLDDDRKKVRLVDIIDDVAIAVVVPNDLPEDEIISKVLEHKRSHYKDGLAEVKFTGLVRTYPEAVLIS